MHPAKIAGGHLFGWWGGRGQKYPKNRPKLCQNHQKSPFFRDFYPKTQKKSRLRREFLRGTPLPLSEPMTQKYLSPHPWIKSFSLWSDKSLMKERPARERNKRHLGLASFFVRIEMLCGFFPFFHTNINHGKNGDRHRENSCGDCSRHQQNLAGIFFANKRTKEVVRKKRKCPSESFYRAFTNCNHLLAIFFKKKFPT